MGDPKIREALEKAYEGTGNNFEPKEEPVEASAVESEGPPPDTSQDDTAAQEAISGDESKEDIKKADSEAPSPKRDAKGGKEPQKEDLKVTPPTPLEDAPTFWKAEDKVAWAKVPPEIRSVLKKYEDSRNAALARYKQVINDKVGQWADASFDEVFPQERMRALQIEGKTPAQATQGLWAWNDYLEQSPHEAILEMMDRYELTPEDLYNHRMGNPIQAQQQTFQDPRVDELIQQNQQFQQQQEASKIKNALDAFGNEQANGKPLRPYWNDVKPYIKSILPLVYQENPSYTDYEALHAAYERAIYANPSVRTKLVNTGTQVKFSDEKTLRAKEAASASLTGSSSRTAEPPKTAKTARQALERAWNGEVPA